VGRSTTRTETFVKGVAPSCYGTASTDETLNKAQSLSPTQIFAHVLFTIMLSCFCFCPIHGTQNSKGATFIHSHTHTRPRSSHIHFTVSP
jgi:hypothetical protein